MKIMSVTLPVPARQPEEHDNDEFRDEIKCPSCGKIDWGHAEYLSSLQHDGDKTETECHYCGKPMRVTLCVEYSYATAPIKPKEGEGTCLCGQTTSAPNKNGIWVWPKGHAGYWVDDCCRKPREGA